MRKETVARLETFVFSVMAPVFFGIVGLEVNLWSLGGGGMLSLVIGVACLGKLVGCTLGAIWGGLRFWEAASIAVAMNARGAMEIVVASIGLVVVGAENRAIRLFFGYDNERLIRATRVPVVVVVPHLGSLGQ